MNPKRKIAQIDRLADAIGYVAGDFERFGGAFVDALLETPINHQGLNLLGYPVARVVDSVSDDGRMAVEYSDASGYFDGTMIKAEGDLRKALERRPTATNFFLLSGERRRPQIAQAFESRARAWPEMKGKGLHLWGAEEIASRILEQLIFSDTIVRSLAHYLPELQRIRDEEAASRLAPRPNQSHLLRRDVSDELSRRFSSDLVTVISGLGGNGKSAAAAAYASGHQDEYDLVIWLEAGEVQRPQDLHAVPLDRGGETRNVTALLQTRACLLVVDDADPGLSARALAELCGSRSRILLTRRNVTPDSFELPLLTRSEALEILQPAGASCSSEVFDAIWSTVGGHPLTLGLMNAAVVQGASWTDIVADCRAVGELPDGNQSLADRLLGRLRPALERELSVFSWLGQPVATQDFLEEVVQPVGVRKLRGNGLTAVDRSGLVRLHDVVFAALGSAAWVSPERRVELGIALEAYLVTAAYDPGLRFWASARVLRPKLERLVGAGIRKPAFLYALLSVWDTGEFQAGLIGDPISDAQALAGAPPPLATMAVIEAAEQLFLHEKQDGDAVAEARLEARLPAFDLLAALPGLSDREASEIQHHKGKALKRLRRIAEATNLFEQVLGGAAPMNETRLQLIDVYRGNPERVERAIQLVDEIMGRLPGEPEVTYSVLLGVIERLPWGGGAWRATVIRRHADAIERAIAEAANVGVQQAFRAFAGLGRYLSTEDPVMFERILRQLPEPSHESLQTDNDKFAWGEIYFEAGRLPDASQDRLHAKALALFEAEAKPQRFHQQRRAELLIDMGRSEESEQLLRSRGDLEDNEWVQRLMARARLAQGDAENALVWIDRALKKLKAEQHRSAFLELRYDIRNAVGDPQAGEDLRKARLASQREVEAARLEARIQVLCLDAAGR